MEYKDMIDGTVLTITYNPAFEATRLQIVNGVNKDQSAIDLDNDSLLILVNQLNEIIENQKI